MIQVGDKFKINAVKRGKIWTHFGIHPKYAHMWGQKAEDVEEVEITVKEIDVWLSEWYRNNDENAAIYFGFYDYETGYCKSLMRCNAKVYNCCFTYGADNHCWKWENGKKTDERTGCTFIFEVNG